VNALQLGEEPRTASVDPDPPAGDQDAAGWLRFDPGLVQLRTATAILAGAVASFLTAWLIEALASLQTDVVVLAVVLAVTAGRAQRRSERRGRLLAFVVLPLVVGGSGEVSNLMLSHAVIGDAVFAVALGATIWIRRFGPRWAQLGTQATLPLVVLLIVPAPPGAGLDHALWSALIAIFTVSWVTLSQIVAEAVGFLPAATRPARPATGGNQQPSPGGQSTSRWAPSTRLAVQMAAGLGGAFAVGHWLWPEHWSWVVLTAYVVASGNRSRADVLHKSGLRVLGAACGTVAATLLTSAFPPGDRWTVVVIFAVLMIASWLRSVSYAYWAAAVTADLALLYGYFGQHGTGLLVDRLEGILLGAVIAVAAAWILLPVRTDDLLRRAVAGYLAALGDCLAALRQHDCERMVASRARAQRILDQIDQIAPPLAAHHRITPWQRDAHPIAAITALRDTQRVLRQLTNAPLDVPDDPGAVREDQPSPLEVDLAAIRRSLAPPPHAGQPSARPPLPVSALADLPRRLGKPSEADGAQSPCAVAETCADAAHQFLFQRHAELGADVTVLVN
jgi:hypothetical protein